MLFERITGDKTVWYESDMMEMAGWYVVYSGMDEVTLQAEDSSGNVLGVVEFTESTDIRDYLLENGKDVSGSERCRFHLKIYVEDKTQPVYLKAYQEGKLLDSYALTEGAAGFDDGDSRLNLDWLWDVPERHGFLAKINYKGEILNGVRDVYRYTGGVLAAVGVLAYLVLSVRLALQYMRRHKEGPKNEAQGHRLEQWLVLSALLASYLVLLSGISYSEISGWNAILYWYLSGAYPLMGAFEILAVIFLIQNVLCGEGKTMPDC